MGRHMRGHLRRHPRGEVRPGARRGCCSCREQETRTLRRDLRALHLHTSSGRNHWRRLVSKAQSCCATSVAASLLSQRTQENSRGFVKESPLPSFAEILRLSWLRLLRRAAATLDVPTDLCQMLEILGLKRSLKHHKLLRRWQKAAPFRQRLSKAITLSPWMYHETSA